jgi:predicted aspartyl protease
MNRRAGFILMVAWVSFVIFMFAITARARAPESAVEIPIYADNGVPHVVVSIPGVEPEVEMILDTGAAMVLLPEWVVGKIKGLKYEEEQIAILANGQELTYSEYTLETLIVGTCVIHNVTVAIFPGNSRGLLGISALAKVSPVTLNFSTNKLSVVCS